jgi:DNA modification methylase
MSNLKSAKVGGKKFDMNTIYEGNCEVILPQLPSNSVDCVVTSPPYY